MPFTVRVNKDSVKATLSQFPSTTIIHEKEYTKRLEPQSLSVNIVTNSIKAYRKHNRDSKIPQVSIGSFFNTSHIKLHSEFSKNIRTQLRQELVKDKSIALTERLLPSNLLTEFELTRTGITENIARNLSAPPSDILLYGEFQPKLEQDLNKQYVELDFSLFFISPTGLCENRKVNFSCYSNEIEPVIKQALKLIEQVSSEIRANLESGQNRNFSTQEFEEFKQQAFRLMPNPPYPDGNYVTEENNFISINHISQAGKADELELALNMLECALLFKGDDTQVLVCAGGILYGMAKLTKEHYTLSEREQFNNSSLELIKKAYLIESNRNTRNAYYDAFIHRSGSKEIKPAYIQAAKYIWDTRNTEKWESDYIYEALKKLLEQETDTEQLCQLIIENISESEDPEKSIKLYKTLIAVVQSRLINNMENTETSKLFIECSGTLINQESLYPNWFGHLLYMSTYSVNYTNGKEIDSPVEFVDIFHSALNIIDKIRINHKRGSLTNEYLVYNACFKIYDELVTQYNLTDDTLELKEKYLLEMGKARHLDLFYIGNIFNSLLTQYRENGEYQHGYNIISELVKNNPQQSYLIEEQKKFENALHNNISQNTLLDNTQKINNFFTKIEFDNNIKDSRYGDNIKISIRKLVVSQNGIFGMSPNGLVFKVSPTEKKAIRLKQSIGTISDFACTGKFIAIATQKNGFYLLDSQNMDLKHFTPDNSSFPSNYTSELLVFEDKFIINVWDGKSPTSHRGYLFDPETTKISSPEIENPIPRGLTAKAAPRNLKYIQRSMDNVTSTLIISDSQGNQLINYEGTELKRLNDFDIWQGQLIFAAYNGLYISKTGSNSIYCLQNRDKMVCYCLCPTENELYIGTSDGLYCIEAEQFLELVKQLE